MEIRLERKGDERAVAQLHLAAFGDAHGTVVAGLVDALRAGITPVDGLSLVADDAGRVTGHVLFSRSRLDAPRRLVDVQVLSPVAVQPARQRKGIGSALIRRGLEVTRARGVPVVFVEGPPAYYARFGFGPGEEQGFRRPSLRIPAPAFQALRLPGWEPWMSGTLVYAHPFWDRDAVGLRDPTA